MTIGDIRFTKRSILSQLLLVLWKSILTCCGGIRELSRVKKLSRELAGLGPVPDEGNAMDRSHVLL